MIGASFLRRALPSARTRRQAKPIALIWLDVFMPDNRRAVEFEAPWHRGDFRPRPVANPRTSK